MIGWEPRDGGPWHLTAMPDDLTHLCGHVAGIESYVQRDPHKVDHLGGTRCAKCWMEWRLRNAACLASQDQHEAERRAAS